MGGFGPLEPFRTILWVTVIANRVALAWFMNQRVHFADPEPAPHQRSGAFWLGPPFHATIVGGCFHRYRRDVAPFRRLSRALHLE